MNDIEAKKSPMRVMIHPDDRAREPATRLASGGKRQERKDTGLDWLWIAKRVVPEWREYGLLEG